MTDEVCVMTIMRAVMEQKRYRILLTLPVGLRLWQLIIIYSKF